MMSEPYGTSVFAKFSSQRTKRRPQVARPFQTLVPICERRYPAQRGRMETTIPSESWCRDTCRCSNSVGSKMSLSTTNRLPRFYGNNALLNKDLQRFFIALLTATRSCANEPHDFTVGTY